MEAAPMVFPVRYVSEGAAIQTTSRGLSSEGVAVRSLIPPRIGARVSLAVGIVAMLTATAIGVLIGLSAAYFGRGVDTALMRLTDVMMSIPALLLATASGSTIAVRMESDGVRVGSDLVTGASVSLKEAGATPLLVSGSIVEWMATTVPAAAVTSSS